MKINKKIILFTYDFPLGNSENTFLKFEVKNLIKNFKEIEVVPQFVNHSNIKLTNRFKLNLGLSKNLNTANILFFGIFFTLFSKQFYSELSKILFSEKFLIKFKMIFIEITKSEITYRWIKKNKKYNSKDTILYSFWSNFILLSFEKLKKENHSIVTISRTLGSDLNGFLKNDNYVPYIKKKFYSLNHLFVLEKNQKKILLKNKLINKSKISIMPLGVYKQNKIGHKLTDSRINFLSCHNLIKIKNTLLILDFLKQFSKQMGEKKKVIFYLIGDGEEEEKILQKAFELRKYFVTKKLKKVDNLLPFLKKKKINYFINLSSQEGMSFTIMEAMSCGIPVITSNILANKYLVSNSRGYNIDLENFESSSKKMIKKLTHDFINKKNYYKKSYNSKMFIDNNLLNYKCNENFITKLKKLNLNNK